jgi:hypothetical protein
MLSTHANRPPSLQVLNKTETNNKNETTMNSPKQLASKDDEIK